MPMFTNISADFERVSDRPGLLGLIKFYLFHRGFRATMLFRCAHWLYAHHVRIIPELVTAHCLTVTGADIPYPADIEPGLVILHPVGVVIGGRTKIGKNCTLMQGVTLGAKWSRGGLPEYPVIGDNVVIGAGAKVLGKVTIGDDAIIGANAVVLSDIPPGATAVGIPAQPLQPS
jgi:serine O-acetyltransferase